MPRAHNSWSHRLARLLVRPLVGTAVRPDHVTGLRVLVGAAACLGFAWGGREAQVWGGTLWVAGALLDRADGELARLSGQISAKGAIYDYVSDLAVNSAMFVAVGIGLRQSGLGVWAPALGLLCGLCFGLLFHWCEVLEERVDPEVVVLGGGGGFDPDDAFYLLGPLAWMGMLGIVPVAGAIVLPPLAAAVGLRLWRARKRLAEAAAQAERGV